MKYVVLFFCLNLADNNHKNYCQNLNTFTKLEKVTLNGRARIHFAAELRKLTVYSVFPQLVGPACRIWEVRKQIKAHSFSNN